MAFTSEINFIDRNDNTTSIFLQNYREATIHTVMIFSKRTRWKHNNSNLKLAGKLQTKILKTVR